MKKIGKISESELDLMNLIWKNDGSIYFAELQEQLIKMGREWKTNTVLTFLARLKEKGFLKVEKRGRINLYVAVYQKEEYEDTQAKGLIDQFYEGSAKKLICALLRQNHLSKQELKELEEYWEEEKDGNE